MRRVFSGGLAALLLVALTALPVQAASIATRIFGLTQVKLVAASGDTYAALRADGTVWVWDGSAGSAATVKPEKVAIGSAAKWLMLGSDRIVLVCADGTVWTAPLATSDGAVHAAVQVPGLDSVKSVAVARTGLVALRTDGTVWTAGFATSDGGLSPAEQVADLSGVMAIAAGIDDFVAIEADGTAYARMAINTKGIPHKRVSNLPPVRSVAVCGPDDDCDGTDPYLFETNDGHLWTWTVGADAAAGPLPFDPLQCSACIWPGHARFLTLTGKGDAQMVVLSADGRVIVNDIKRPALTGLKQMAPGRRFDMGLAADGTVWLWPAPGQSAQVPGLSGIAQIAAAGDWSLALGADGRLWCWGGGTNERPLVIPHVFESNPRGIKAGDFGYVTLYGDGSIGVGAWPAAGGLPGGPVKVPDVAAKEAVIGDMHVAILKIDGTVADAEVTVDGSGVHIGQFHDVSGLDGVVQMAAGETGLVALRADGTAWGRGWDGTVHRVTDVAGARSVSAAGGSYAVLMGDGSVRGIAIDEQGAHVWGDPHVDQADAITGGSLALRADGTVMTYSHTAGAVQVAGIQNGIAVAEGGSADLVLRADGTVWQWRTTGQ